MEATAFKRELPKKRVINNDLQYHFFYEKRANEHLKRQQTAFQGDLRKQLQEAQVTLENLQGELKVAHSTNAKLKA